MNFKFVPIFNNRSKKLPYNARIESVVSCFCLLGVEEMDWLKKFSSSSVLKPIPDAAVDTLETCEVLFELSSEEAFMKLVNISESEADFLVGVSFVGVSDK